MFKFLTLSLLILGSLTTIAAEKTNSLSTDLDLLTTSSVKVCQNELVAFNFNKSNDLTGAYADSKSIGTVNLKKESNSIVFQTYKTPTIVLIEFNSLETHALQIEPVECKNASAQLKYPKVFNVANVFNQKSTFKTSSITDKFQLLEDLTATSVGESFQFKTLVDLTKKDGSILPKSSIIKGVISGLDFSTGEMRIEFESGIPTLYTKGVSYDNKGLYMAGTYFNYYSTKSDFNAREFQSKRSDNKGLLFVPKDIIIK